MSVHQALRHWSRQVFGISETKEALLNLVTGALLAAAILLLGAESLPPTGWATPEGLGSQAFYGRF